jgi:hypothetical protein
MVNDNNLIQIVITANKPSNQNSDLYNISDLYTTMLWAALNAKDRSLFWTPRAANDGMV